jgi:hypothetical protein
VSEVKVVHLQVPVVRDNQQNMVVPVVVEEVQQMPEELLVVQYTVVRVEV